MAEADPKIIVAAGEFRANMSSYLKKISEGASFVIVSRGKPVADVVAHAPPPPLGPRPLGLMKGQFTIPDDFDTLPDDIIESFYASKLDDGT